MKSEYHENEALKMLSDFYYKVLKINLAEDSHEDIKLLPLEQDPETGYSEMTSKWL